MAVVREAERSDLDGLVQLRGLAGEDLGKLDHRLAPDPRPSGRLRRTLRSMMGRHSASVVVAEAEDGRGLAGCAMGTVVNNEPFTVPDYGYVNCLYVREGHRGSGVGSSLFAGVCDWLRGEGVSVIQADVSARDRASLRFWSARGFERFLDQLRLDAGAVVESPDVPAVAVRTARSGDSEAVIRLWKEMMDFHATVDGRLSVGSGWRDEVSRASRRWLRGGDTWLLVAEVGGRVIGFVVGSVVDGVLGLKPSTHGHIAHLCVTAEWRRRGVGRQLLSSLSSWFLSKGMSSIHAHISHYSPVSQQFWRALGFEDYIERLWCDLA